MGGAKPGEISACFRQAIEVRAPHAEGSDRIDEQPHFHSALRRGDEPGEHCIPARVVVPDVKLNVHMMPCLIDALGQRRIELCAIHQQPRMIGARDRILVNLRK